MATDHRQMFFHNQNYVRSGLKSYSKALAKYNFNPTKPGPCALTAAHAMRFSKLGAFGRFATKILPKKTVKPSSSRLPADDVQHDAEYLCSVSIGTSPPQVVHLDFDTGSSDLWVWSTRLPAKTLNEFRKDHTVFNPYTSPTWTDMKGSSWRISYGDGSNASGLVGNDTLALGSVIVPKQAIEIATNLSPQFEQGAGDGLLGLAFPTINTVKPDPVKTPVQNLIDNQQLSKSTSLFTAYLGSDKDKDEADKGQSFYTFGVIDPGTLAACKVKEEDIHYASVDSSKGFWQFSSQSLRINGSEMKLGLNTAIADTGTTLALVSDDVCEAIYNAIPGAKYDESQQGWLFPTSVEVDALPTIELDVGGRYFTVQKEDLAFAEAGNMYYGGIQSRGTLSFDILGDTFLKAIYAIFDQGNMRFGAVQRHEAHQHLEVRTAREILAEDSTTL